MASLAGILPAAFYNDQQTWALWIVFLVALAALVWGAERTVSSAVRLARRLGMSKVIVGATVVSLGTTSPEACVSVVAAIRGNPGLALGNAVGSIIVDTALIFGLCCVIRRLPLDRFILNRHGWIQLGAGLLLAGICYGLLIHGGGALPVVLPRYVGVFFLLLLAGYMYISVVWARRHPAEAIEGVDEVTHGQETSSSPWLTLLGLLIGLGVVVVSSEVVVGAAEVICRRANVPESVLAVTLVAFGTSLPELATAVAALLKGHEELTIGNIVGADILNVLFVAGAASAAAPLQVDASFFRLHLPVMVAALVIFRLYILFGKDRFHRWQGVPLLALYALFLFLTMWMTVAS